MDSLGPPEWKHDTLLYDVCVPHPTAIDGVMVTLKCTDYRLDQVWLEDSYDC